MHSHSNTFPDHVVAISITANQKIWEILPRIHMFIHNFFVLRIEAKESSKAISVDILLTLASSI
jgi:hypothetical protein